MVPTDKSMPAVMMTKVHAIASTPLTAVDCRMLTRLSTCRKFSLAKLKNTTSASKLAKASSFCRVDGWNRRARRLPAPASELAVDVMVRFACNSGRTLRCQLHDFFLRGFGGGEFAGDAAFAHDQHAVAHAQHFWQLGRNHHDGLALFCEGVEQFVDFALGADVNATRRLIKKQDVAIAQQPLGDDDLLLVAAGQQACRLIDGRRLDGELAHIALRSAANRRLIEEKTLFQETIHARHDDVGLHIETSGQTEMLAVFRQVTDAMCDGVGR